jgi:hypothetical protein
MAGSGFEFEEIRNLAKQFKKAVDERVIERFIREFMLEMAYRTQAKFKRRTSVNTGDLRRKWMVGKVEKHGNSYVVEIYNNLDYASFIEYGFRSHFVPGEWQGNQFQYIPGHDEGMWVGGKSPWVPGKFMMTISMKEMEREFPKFLERRQLKLLNQIMTGRPNGGGSN